MSDTECFDLLDPRPGGTQPEYLQTTLDIEPQFGAEQQGKAHIDGSQMSHPQRPVPWPAEGWHRQRVKHGHLLSWPW